MSDCIEILLHPIYTTTRVHESASSSSVLRSYFASQEFYQEFKSKAAGLGFKGVIDGAPIVLDASTSDVEYQQFLNKLAMASDQELSAFYETDVVQQIAAPGVYPAYVECIKSTSQSEVSAQALSTISSKTCIVNVTWNSPNILNPPPTLNGVVAIGAAATTSNPGPGTQIKPTIALQFDRNSDADWEYEAFIVVVTTSRGSCTASLPGRRKSGTIDAWDSGFAVLPSRRGALAATVVKSDIYVLGGATIDSKGKTVSLGTAQVYNTVSKQWFNLPPITPRHALSATADNQGRVYAIGGYSVEKGPLTLVEVYDPNNPSAGWKQCAQGNPMKFPHVYGSAVCIGNRLYVLGDQISQVIETYDPITDAFTPHATPMDFVRYDAAVAVINNQIYVIGGRDQYNVLLDTVFGFDPNGGPVPAIPPLLSPRNGMGAAVDALGRLYVVGGYSTSVIGAVDMYDPTTPGPGWKPCPASLHFRREGLGVVFSDTMIWAIGGDDNHFYQFDIIEVMPV